MNERRVRIGNQSAALADRWDLPWRFALECGFDAFEWFPDRPGARGGFSPRDISPVQRASIRKLARAHDIALSVHGALGDGLLGVDAGAKLQDDLELARDIGALLLNVHLDLGSGLGRFVRGVAAVVHRMGGSPTVLALENTVADAPVDINAVFASLDGRSLLADGRVGLCLDVGHANLCAATRNDYLRFVEALDARVPIVHLHLHENHGDRDSHLTVFTGPAGQDPAALTGLLRRLRARGFTGSIILEQWPEPPDLLVSARSRLQEMLRSA